MHPYMVVLLIDIVVLQIDVFSFAMTIYELLTVYKPYELLCDINAPVRLNDVVTRMERPSIAGKVVSDYKLLTNTYCV